MILVIIVIISYVNPAGQFYIDLIPETPPWSQGTAHQTGQ